MPYFTEAARNREPEPSPGNDPGKGLGLSSTRRGLDSGTEGGNAGRWLLPRHSEEHPHSTQSLRCGCSSAISPSQALAQQRPAAVTLPRRAGPAAAHLLTQTPRTPEDGENHPGQGSGSRFDFSSVSRACVQRPTVMRGPRKGGHTQQAGPLPCTRTLFANTLSVYYASTLCGNLKVTKCKTNQKFYLPGSGFWVASGSGKDLEVRDQNRGR